MSAYLTGKELAQLLGVSRDTLRLRMKQMQAEGFPARDPILGRFNRIAVEQWLADRASGAQGASTATVEVNYDAFR